ncbi:Cytochrome b561 homolog 2 [Providencia rustigianii]|nr:Cytochrome b561 homolog 2 [Providencia rustigianii]
MYLVGLMFQPYLLVAATQADSAGEIHLYLAWAVVLLSVLHAFAALKHHFYDGDITLKRMLGFNPDK